MTSVALLAEAMEPFMAVELDGFRPTPSRVLFVATTPSSTSKADWSALLERPVVSELCSAAMLLPCAATCPSVVARAAAGQGRNCRRQRAAVQLSGQLCGGQSQGQLPCGDVRAVRYPSVVQDLRDVARDRSFKHVYICFRRHNDLTDGAGQIVTQPVGDLKARLRGFGLGARPAVRLRSWSEAGSAASVLEPAPGPHQARARPAPGPHQARARPAPGPHQARTWVFRKYRGYNVTQ